MAANTIRSGMTTASIVAIILFVLNEDALMSSLDDSRVTRSMAISAPPTPPLRTAVIDTALDVALDVNVDAAITKLIIIMRQLVLFNIILVRFDYSNVDQFELSPKGSLATSTYMDFRSWESE